MTKDIMHDQFIEKLSQLLESDFPIIYDRVYRTAMWNRYCQHPTNRGYSGRIILPKSSRHELTSSYDEVNGDIVQNMLSDSNSFTITPLDLALSEYDITIIEADNVNFDFIEGSFESHDPARYGATFMRLELSESRREEYPKMCPQTGFIIISTDGSQYHQVRYTDDFVLAHQLAHVVLDYMCYHSESDNAMISQFSPMELEVACDFMIFYNIYKDSTETDPITEFTDFATSLNGSFAMHDRINYIAIVTQIITRKTEIRGM